MSDDVAMEHGPARLFRRLVDAGADVRVVGSVASAARVPADLDVVVDDDLDKLEELLTAIRAVGGTSRLSTSLPTVAQLRNACQWHFNALESPLDVFVDRREQ